MEEQAVIQSTLISITFTAIKQANEKGEIETVRKLGNSLNMQQKALTDIQHALLAQSKSGKKTKSVVALTEQTATSGTDAAP